MPTRFRQSAALRYCYCITPAHSLSSQFLADTNRIKNNGSAFAALAPQAHLFGVGNQLLTEIWVGNVDQGFGTFPGGQALQAGNAVLGHQIIGVGAGIGHNTAGVQRGADAAFGWGI